MSVKNGACYWPDPDRFPVDLYILYFFSYAGQSIYATYLNLYLAGIGFSQSRIGIILSVSTFFTLLAQMAWGVASDKAKSKNTVVSFLFAACAVSVLMMYLSEGFWPVLAAASIYSSFLTGINPLTDDMALELSEGKTWNFGQIRAGGTMGYCAAVLLIGFIINGRYERIFYMSSIAWLAAFALSFAVPFVPGHRTAKQKTPFRALLKNKPLMALIAYGLVFSMGTGFFYNFYPIYYTSIGGSSSQVGILMFCCAVTEIPCLMLAGRAVKRFGIGKVMAVSGGVTALRWLLLFLLKDPYAVIAASLLHGIGFIGNTFCVVTYISTHVPKDLRATGQSFNVFVTSIFSRFLLGYAGGLASEAFGADNIMLVSFVCMIAATAVFWAWARRNRPAFE